MMDQVLNSKFWGLVILALIVMACGLRFVGLEQSPPGFYVDEAAIAAQVICLRQSGHDVAGTSWPLFSAVLGAGYATPAQLYGGALWTSLFGDSIESFRSFAAVHGVLLVIGLYFLALILWSRREIAGLVALTAAFSPWAFQFSRIAWDPPLAPCYFIWGFVLILHEGWRWRLGRALLGGLLLALACYSYPPMRVQAAMVLPVFAGVLFFAQRALRVRLGLAAMTFLISIVPLVSKMLLPEFQQRSKFLSLFNPDYLLPMGGFSWPLVLKLFFENMGSHFSATFLFLSGDTNLRHSSQAWGQWGLLEIGALVLVPVLFFEPKLQRRHWVLLALCFWGYLAGLAPAALTWESNPHALRALGATPFLSLATGFILFNVGQRWRLIAPVIFLGTLVFSTFYFSHYFKNYPVQSRAWFDAEVVQTAQQAPNTASLEYSVRAVQPDYPELALRYFSLSQGRDVCR